MTETEEKWAERVRQWRAGGLSASEFAQGQGFEPSTLRYWASQLKRRDKAPAKPPAARVRMIRVRRVESHARVEEVMVVAVGAARVEVRPGFDPALLRALVEALGA